MLVTSTPNLPAFRKNRFLNSEVETNEITNSIRKAADMINGAKKPVLYVGKV